MCFVLEMCHSMLMTVVIELHRFSYGIRKLKILIHISMKVSSIESWYSKLARDSNDDAQFGVIHEHPNWTAWFSIAQYFSLKF